MTPKDGDGSITETFLFLHIQIAEGAADERSLTIQQEYFSLKNLKNFVKGDSSRRIIFTGNYSQKMFPKPQIRREGRERKERRRDVIWKDTEMMRCEK